MKLKRLIVVITGIALAVALLPALLSAPDAAFAQISVLPTWTYTPVPRGPTDTPVPPTPTDTPVPPTNTPPPPTNTPPPPTNTPTPIPPGPVSGSFSIVPLEGVAQIDTAINFSVVFTDPGLSINLGFATFAWGDGHTSTCPPDDTTACWIDLGVGSVDQVTSSSTFMVGEVKGRHMYSEPGVYTVQLTLRDKSGQFTTSTYEYVVVYDPTAGFVTGGGWIDSPPGAFVPDPTLTGKATFGFVSKYKRGAQTPSGNTEFQFKAGDLNFHSDSYDWLVIAGRKAMYKGTGTINGGGNYGFLLSAIDAALTPSTDVDLFRIKIWDKDNGDALIYDNQLGDADDADPGTPIGGGSIVIHSGKGNRR